VTSAFGLTEKKALQMPAFKTLDDFDVSGKRVLVRVDLNLPMAGEKITDATRLERIVPTIKELVDENAKVILLSHFGRPKGERVPDMSLEPIAKAAAPFFGKEVCFVSDCIGQAAKAAIDAMKNGDILLLENTRYYAGEEENDPKFIKALAENGDIYVNDAFSTAHRAHASSEGLAHILPTAAGRAMEAELKALATALTEPKRPVVAFVGGAKVSSKLELLGNLVKKVDVLVIGGGMANTFLAAMGKPVGKSLCEHNLADTARDIMKAAEEANCELLLPRDVVVALEFKAGANARTILADDVGPDDMILDIGTAAIADIAQRLETASTVVWNGPMGAFEISPFNNGTDVAARHVGMLTEAGRLISVAGGGDTVAALVGAGADHQFTYISAAGGAFLEWLEGKSLPGVKALEA
jgi:phosphoglycerate kinase